MWKTPSVYTNTCQSIALIQVNCWRQRWSVNIKCTKPQSWSVPHINLSCGFKKQCVNQTLMQLFCSFWSSTAPVSVNYRRMCEDSLEISQFVLHGKNNNMQIWNARDINDRTVLWIAPSQCSFRNGIRASLPACRGTERVVFPRMSLNKSNSLWHPPTASASQTLLPNSLMLFERSLEVLFDLFQLGISLL